MSKAKSGGEAVRVQPSRGASVVKDFVTGSGRGAFGAVTLDTRMQRTLADRPLLLVVWLACACALWLAGAAVLERESLAQSRTAYLIDRLKYPPPSGLADDFRVRTNAALALGATRDEAAVAPLCQGLSDPSDVVRQAVAAALNRLASAGSLGCLRARLAVEQNADVKLQITRTIDALAAASTPPPEYVPKNVQNARFYVALSPIANRTGRPQGEIDKVILAAVRDKLDSLGNVQIAPMREAPDAARAALAKRKMKGYYLEVAVEKFDYSDGNLRIRVKCAVFDYPGKNLRGEIPAGITQSGVSPGDRSAEDNLMRMAAERVVELFSQNFR